MEEYTIHKVRFTHEAIFDYEYGIDMGEYPLNYFFAEPQDSENLKAKIRETNRNSWKDDEHFEQPFALFPYRQMKAELEEYIQRRAKHKDYFHVDWLDDNYDQMLTIFIKRGQKTSIMQTWEVIGICEKVDTDAEGKYLLDIMEEFGHLRCWYNTKITDLPDSDWVESERKRFAGYEQERLIDEKERERHERLFG